MDIKGGIKWRYQIYARPYLLLDENFYKAIARRFHNIIESRKKTTIICYISANATNAGDHASAIGVRYLSNRQGVELYAAKAALRETFRVISAIKMKNKKAAILIGGGGLIQEWFAPFWKGLLQYDVPFALFGVGANMLPPERNLPPNSILDGIAHRAVAIHVRDKWTQRILQRGQKNKVIVGICPSVNYLVDKFGRCKEDKRSHLLYVQHPVDVQMAGGDPLMMKRIVKEVAHEFGLLYDEASQIKEDLDSLVKRYQRARFVISSRLHGCIFSYAFGIPFVPIACDRKTGAFIETHVPEAPMLGVNFTKEECIEKLLQAQLSTDKSEESLRLSLENNVIAMQDAYKNLGLTV